MTLVPEKQFEMRYGKPISMWRYRLREAFRRADYGVRRQWGIHQRITFPNGTRKSWAYGLQWAKDCVGKGWHPILDQLFADLHLLGWDGNLYQVKEKFGGLRFYTGGMTQGMSDLVDGASYRSNHTCEDCGARGKHTGRGWIRTLCSKCDKTDLR